MSLLLLFRPYGSGTPPAPVVVRRRGGDRNLDDDYKKRRERLREQLEAAFNGHFGIVAEESLAEFIAPQVADSVVRGAIDRVDWQQVWARYDEVIQRLDKLARAQEDDDDESLLLLS